MTDRHTNGELGRAAYEAYARFVDHTTVSGEVMWPWQELPPHLTAAWSCAALAVKGLITTEERANRESETER